MVHVPTLKSTQSFHCRPGSRSRNRKFRKPRPAVLALADTTGHEAVLVKNKDAVLEGAAGLCPDKATVVMGKKKISMRSKVKVCNYLHLMPIRYPVHLKVTRKRVFRDPVLKCKAQGRPGSSLETGTR